MTMFVFRLILKAKSGWHSSTVSSYHRASIASSFMRCGLNVFWNSSKSVVSSAGGRCPFGLIPILEVEGVTLCQSMAILRFVAKRHGMSNCITVLAFAAVSWDVTLHAVCWKKGCVTFKLTPAQSTQD